MVYHVIRRPLYNPNNSLNQSPSNSEDESSSKLMPRYHYSKLTPNSATASAESFFPRQQLNGQSSKPIMTTMTSTNGGNNNNNHNQYSYGSLKSSFVPLVTNFRTMTPSKRDFIQIPVTREDGTTISSNPLRSVPITFMSETTPLSSTTNSTSGNTSPKPLYTSLLRPGSRYSQHHSTSSGDESSTNTLRFPSVSRRLSLTIPVMTTITKSDDDSIKQNIPTSSIRQIPIRLSQPSNAASIPSNNHSRISSAVLRSSSLSNPTNNQLKRQKTDLTDVSSSDFATAASNSSSPIRRAEAMAREAIQGVARFQQQQQQQRNDSNSENNNPLIRSPGLSRRVIVNLKNNQSVSLDSRLSSANGSSTKPPPTPSGSRLSQRNNLFHIPVLRDIQIPSNSSTTTTDSTLQVPPSPSASNHQRNSSNFKNEFRMEIPVTVVTHNDQENPMEENDDRDDGLIDYDPPIVTVVERLSATNGNHNNSHPTLKSILKRSSSRETVTRKNVSFMNA